MASTNFPVIFDTTPEHLKPSDHELLKAFTNEDNTFAGGPIVSYGIDDYGWMIRTDGGRKSGMQDQDELARYREQKIAAIKEAGFSDEFVAIYRHAWDNDAVFLSLDRDANPEPGFPLFESETGDMYDDGSGNDPRKTPAP